MNGPIPSCHQFRILGMCLGLLLPGCAVGPNFNEPNAPPTDTYTEAPLPEQTVRSEETPGMGGLAQQFLIGSPIPPEWWNFFASDCLNDIVAYGLANSPTVEAAKAALREAQANYYAQMGSTLLPALNWTFTGQRTQFSFDSIGFGGVSTFPSSALFNLFNTQINLSYNLDVFGKSRREIEGYKALVDYQRYELEATYLMLTANIVTTALTEATLRAQICATEELISSQSELLDIVKGQFELGGVSKADVLSQQTQLAQTMATLPPLEKSLSQQRHLLSVLIGDLPSECSLPEFRLCDLTLPPFLPLSLPSTLVRRRPDVRAQEALMHQACAKIGVATANFFPQFDITGYYGFDGQTLSNLIIPNNKIFDIGWQVAQPLFQGFSLFFKRRAAVAAYEQANEIYREVALKAFQNVADALRAVEKDAEALKAQAHAEHSALETMNMTRDQFKLGAVPYINLLNAEKTYQETVINRIQAEGLRYTDTVALFQALGGEWWSCEHELG